MSAEQLGLRGRGGQIVLHRMETDFLGFPALAGDVEPARRIVADEDHGKARRHARLAAAGVPPRRRRAAVIPAATARPSIRRAPSAENDGADAIDEDPMLEVETDGAGEHGRLDVAPERDHLLDRHGVVDASRRPAR